MTIVRRIGGGWTIKYHRQFWVSQLQEVEWAIFEAFINFNK